MLYYLIEYLGRLYDVPLLQVMQFIVVRATLAAFTALVIALFLGKRIIRWLRKHQLGEQVRGDLIVDHAHKAGTPTMGGIIILLSILSGILMWGDVRALYVWLIVLAVVGAGVIGLADDYIKTIKKNKKGLTPCVKLIGQATLGILVGTALFFHPQFADVRHLTYLPFTSEGLIDYGVLGTLSPVNLTWMVYIGVSVFIITALSNSVNITDGLDGLATGVTALVSLGLVLLSYLAGSPALTNVLPVLYVPGAGELAVVAATIAAACLGFLYHNRHPARVFMGDTGSLALGAAVGTIALMIRVELLLPILALAFFVEACSVILQVAYFKYSRWRRGTGQRLFPIAPIHHSFEKAGFEERRIAHVFWGVALLGLVITFSIIAYGSFESLTYASLFNR